MKKIIPLKRISGWIPVFVLFALFSAFTPMHENGRSWGAGKATPDADPGNSVTITFTKSDVCGLQCLGSVQVTEKRFFRHNNDLKTETIDELKREADKKGGNVVYVDIKESTGFGIFVSNTYTGFVYQKTK